MLLKGIFISGLLLSLVSGKFASQTTVSWNAEEAAAHQASGEILETQLPIVRANLEWPDEVWVGQAVSLNVEVIVPTWFKDSPKFPDIEIENALTLSTGDAVNAVVQSGGKTFSGQERQYLIFPQVAGTYTIPSITVPVSYARQDGKSSASSEPASPELQFTAMQPPAAPGKGHLLTTDRFEMEQSFDRKLDDLKVGDAITRTVHMTAENTAAMMLPELTFETPEGIRCYTGDSKILDKTDRGMITAERTEIVTYQLTRAGSYQLPEIRVDWWAPRIKKINTDRLAPVDLKVADDPGRSPEVFSSSAGGFSQVSSSSGVLDSDTIRNWGLMILGAGLFFLAAWRLWFRNRMRLWNKLETRRKNRAEAETTFFKRFRKASLSNDARASLRELMFWLDRINTGSDVPRLSHFAKSSGMTGLVREGHILEAFLFALPEKLGPFVCQAGWVGKPLYRMVARERRAQKRRIGKLRQSGRDLFSLNPDPPWPRNALTLLKRHVPARSETGGHHCQDQRGRGRGDVGQL
jgi:hypothetical protein